MLEWSWLSTGSLCSNHVLILIVSTSTVEDAIQAISTELETNVEVKKLIRACVTEKKADAFIRRALHLNHSLHAIFVQFRRRVIRQRRIKSFYVRSLQSRKLRMLSLSFKGWERYCRVMRKGIILEQWQAVTGQQWVLREWTRCCRTEIKYRKVVDASARRRKRHGLRDWLAFCARRDDQRRQRRQHMLMAALFLASRIFRAWKVSASFVAINR